MRPHPPLGILLGALLIQMAWLNVHNGSNAVVRPEGHEWLESGTMG